jgi:hypothetical protein
LPLWAANAGVAMLTAAIATPRSAFETFVMFYLPVRGQQDVALSSSPKRIELHCRKFHHAILNICELVSAEMKYFQEAVDF